MTDTQHTPGPWGADGDAYVVNEYNQVIADVFINDDDNFEERAANARLIAACPELLAALIDLLGMIESPQISVSGVVGGQWEVTKKEARAAIAKATGQ